jgi:hypothetical protein
VVEVVPLKAFRDAAAKKKLKGAAAMTPVGVARAARDIKLDAAVGGEVANGSYKVLIYDRYGGQLWTKELAVKKGALSDDFAGKLARVFADGTVVDVVPEPSVLTPASIAFGRGGWEACAVLTTELPACADPPSTESARLKMLERALVDDYQRLIRRDTVPARHRA